MSRLIQPEHEYKITQSDIDLLMNADLVVKGQNKAREFYTVEELQENARHL